MPSSKTTSTPQDERRATAGAQPDTEVEKTPKSKALADKISRYAHYDRLEG